MTRRTGRSPGQPSRAALGDAAELAALRFLKRQGLGLVRRNFRCRHGEIDLIMRDGECLVVVEVRFRRGTFIPPALTVDSRKQGKLARTAAFFLQQDPALGEPPIRFDVVAVTRASDARGGIQWIRDAFRQ